MTPPRGKISIPEIDEFWDKVDELFGDALEAKKVPKATIVAAAMQAACFASFLLDSSEEEFVEMAKMAWAKSILDYRVFAAELEAESGKVAKA